MKTISEHEMYRKYHKRGGRLIPAGSILNTNEANQ